MLLFWSKKKLIFCLLEIHRQLRQPLAISTIQTCWGQHLALAARIEPVRGIPGQPVEDRISTKAAHSAFRLLLPSPSIRPLYRQLTDQLDPLRSRRFVCNRKASRHNGDIGLLTVRQY